MTTTLMMNTNRNRVSQPLALTWPCSTEALRDVLCFHVHPPPFPTHCRSGQSSKSSPVRVCDECMWGQAGWGGSSGRATDRVVGSRAEGGRDGGVKGSDREGWSKSTLRESHNVLRELRAEVSSHCPLPPVPPSTFTPSCWLVVREIGWNVMYESSALLFCSPSSPLRDSIPLLLSPDPCSAQL